jgi:hypothetical protein
MDPNDPGPRWRIDVRGPLIARQPRAEAGARAELGRGSQLGKP